MRHSSPPSALPFRSPAPERARAAWLYRELRIAILDGALKPGARLPSTRELARDHGLARGTVVVVYDQLKAEGYAESVRGSGTRVSSLLPDNLTRSQPMSRAQPRKNTPRPFASNLPESPFPLVARPTARAFWPNLPSLRDFPVATWARLSSRRIRLSATRLLFDGDVQGYLPLRTAIAEHLGTTRGVPCTAEQVMIVSGTQHALDLVARLLLRPGDAVWMENPGYVGALCAFRNANAKIVPVPVDSEGLVVAAGIRKCKNAKLAYVTPAHQMPLGATLSATRRLALLRWANESGSYIFEDDYDSEYRFRGRPFAALKAIDTEDRVILAGSFGKMLFPTIRLGYLVVPESLREGILRLRSMVDRYPSVINQAVLSDFIAEGHFGQHIRRMRLIYAERQQALMREADRLSPWLQIVNTPAGLQSVSFLAKNRNDLPLVERAARKNIDLMPLSRNTHAGRPINGFLLGFAAYTPHEIAQAAQRLADVLKER